MKIEKFTIGGMSCGHCVARVKQTLQSVDGVQFAEVTLTPPEATITFSKDVALQLLENAIKEAGNYSLTEAARA